MREEPEALSASPAFAPPEPLASQSSISTTSAAAETATRPRSPGPSSILSTVPRSPVGWYPKSADHFLLKHRYSAFDPTTYLEHVRLT